MTANVYVVQYSSFGGRIPGGEDDIGGTMPQFPGRVRVAGQKIAVTDPTGASITLDPDTAFIKIQTYDADVLYNFDTDGWTSINDTNADRITPGQIIFQGVVSNKSKTPFITQVNFKEQT